MYDDLKSGEDYGLLKSTYHIGIIDFPLYDEDTMELEEKKNKTILSKIAVAVVVIYYLLGITAVAAQQYGLKLYEQGNSEMARFFYNKVWDSLAPFVVMIPLIAAIPNVILNIVGIIKEKRVFPFLLCIFAPILIWFVVAAVATAYF